MPIEKFIPTSPDLNLREDLDMAPAKFGHLNRLVEDINANAVKPDGLNGYVQFNNNNAFGGDSAFLWDNVNKRLGIGAIPDIAKFQVVGDGITSSTISLLVKNSASTNLLSVLDNGNVGINTLTPGATLDVNGTANIAERLTIEADSTATTQSTAVIQNTTTNSGIALVPNGTGAITADIPDGTIVGGNARGTNAVDLQSARTTITQVASGNNSVVLGGSRNSASGANSVAGGLQCTANGDSAIALGNQISAGGNNSFCLSSEGNSSGNQSVSIGRQTKSSGSASMALGFTSDTNGKAFSNVYGGGGKSNNNCENIFANSRRQIGEANMTAGGFYQRRHNIVGINSRSTGSSTPELFYTTGLINSLSDNFTSFAGVGNATIYTPLYDNVYFKIEAEIIFAVNAIIGAATGVSVGDYKICKLEGVGRRFGGVNSVLLSTLTVIEESLSMATISYQLTSEFAIEFTNATFAGGGSLDITTMADFVISEMKMNL